MGARVSGLLCVSFECDSLSAELVRKDLAARFSIFDFLGAEKIALARSVLGPKLLSFTRQIPSYFAKMALSNPMLRSRPPQFSLVDTRLHHIYRHNLLVSLSVYVSLQDGKMDVNPRFLLSGNRRVDCVNQLNARCELAPLCCARHPTNPDVNPA